MVLRAWVRLRLRLRLRACGRVCLRACGCVRVTRICASVRVCMRAFLTGGEKMNIPGEIVYFRGFHVVWGFSLIAGVLFAGS